MSGPSHHSPATLATLQARPRTPPYVQIAQRRACEQAWRIAAKSEPRLVVPDTCTISEDPCSGPLPAAGALGPTAGGADGAAGSGTAAKMPAPTLAAASPSLRKRVGRPKADRSHALPLRCLEADVPAAPWRCKSAASAPHCVAMRVKALDPSANVAALSCCVRKRFPRNHWEKNARWAPPPPLCSRFPGLRTPAQPEPSARL